jgi:flagellar motility protein MotE (MotC chaperone)
MKFSPPTQLIIFMFLSFVVVLGTMIALFRPSTPPSRSLSESSAQSAKALASSADTAGEGEGADSARRVTPGTVAVSEGGAAQGQAELNLLKAEVENHLKTQRAAENEKIISLARWCTQMEPGRAAVTLSPLDDATVHRILSQIDKDSALKIQSVLIRIRKGS